MALDGAHRERFQAAGFNEWNRGRHRLEQEVRFSAHHRQQRLAAAFIGNVHHPDPRHQVEQFGRHVVKAAAAGSRIAEAVGLGLGELDQLLDRIDRNRRMDDQQVRAVGDEADGREILHRIECELGVNADVDGLRSHRAEENRVAVGRRAGCQLRRDVAAGAGTVVDQHLLAPALAQPVADDARQYVGSAARPERDDEADRFRRVFLRGNCNRGGGESHRGNCPPCACAISDATIPPLQGEGQGGDG